MKYTMKDAEIVADMLLSLFPRTTQIHIVAKSLKMTVASMEIIYSPNPKVKLEGFMKLIREFSNYYPTSRYPLY